MAEKIRTAIVDDHPMIRDGVAKALADELDITVVADGSTGADAINIAQKLLPDVMLLDIKLPGCGFAAARAISQQAPNVRIIILTASESDDDLSTALNLGVRGYLLKGSSAPEIVLAVRTVFRGSSYVAPTLAARVLRKLSKRTSMAAEDGTEELSEVEAKIMALLAKGMTNKEIANSLDLSVRTVKHRMSNVMQKLQVRNRLEAVVKLRNSESPLALLPDSISHSNELI
jgi:DNA-binding NarL/FixJ family response regulator